MKCCETCGAELVRLPKHSQKQWDAKRFCERQCAAQRLRKTSYCACGCGTETLPQRKYVRGHRPLKVTAQGYRRIWRPGHPLADGYGMVLEHRAVLFDAGLLRFRSAHVHHKNGDKTDNRLENLLVISNADHARLHARLRRVLVTT